MGAFDFCFLSIVQKRGQLYFGSLVQHLLDQVMVTIEHGFEEWIGAFLLVLFLGDTFDLFFGEDVDMIGVLQLESLHELLEESDERVQIELFLAFLAILDNGVPDIALAESCKNYSFLDVEIFEVELISSVDSLHIEALYLTLLHELVDHFDRLIAGLDDHFLAYLA